MKNTEFSLKLVTNCQNSIFFNKLSHFTINTLIDIKFSSCYASDLIPYTYFKYNYTIMNVNIFLSWNKPSLIQLQMIYHRSHYLNYLTFQSTFSIYTLN